MTSVSERLLARAQSMTGEHGWSANESDLHELLCDARAEIARKDAALRPFAQASASIGTAWAPDLPLAHCGGWHGDMLMVRDLRAAAAALANTPAPPDCAPMKAAAHYRTNTPAQQEGGQEDTGPTPFSKRMVEHAFKILGKDDAMREAALADERAVEAAASWRKILAGMKRFGMESTDIGTVDDYFAALAAGDVRDEKPA